ncbi:MAG: hypothetical protein AAGF56_14985, partial [Pseudomonadota bacterium]
LATQVIKYVDASEDDQVISEIVKILGATSQSAEEAFLTAMRVRRANMKARELLLDRVKAYQAKRSAASEPSAEASTEAD